MGRQKLLLKSWLQVYIGDSAVTLVAGGKHPVARPACSVCMGSSGGGWEVTQLVAAMGPAVAGNLWICTSPAKLGFRESKLAEGIPVRAKDFSQSWEDGPRMFPSIKANPGHRVHVPPCEH